MRIKLSAVLALAVIAGLALFSQAAPAEAQPSSPQSSVSNTAPGAIPDSWDDKYVGISIPAVTLFQCPTTACNQGLAHSGDWLVDFCHLDQGTPWGGVWDLLWDQNNNEVGFVSSSWLTGELTLQSCANVGVSAHMTIPAVTLFQCPQTYCNQGLATRGQDIAFVEDLIATSPWGNSWRLIYDHANNEVGWVDAGFVPTN